MRALRVDGGRAGVYVADIPDPSPGPGEVRLRVCAAGVCATDVSAAFNPDAKLTKKRSTTLGHEPAGVIDMIGAGVRGWRVGDRVVVSSIVSCGACVLCARGMSEVCVNATVIGLDHDGALADYLTAPARNLVRLPETVSAEVGAILTDAVATPFHALASRGRLVPGETVGIFGVGGLGQHAVALAKAFGAGSVIAVDTRAGQLEHAMRVGADYAFRADDPELASQIRAVNAGRGVDLAGVFVGSAPAISAAFGAVGKGGRLVVVGLSADNVVLPPSSSFARREVSLIGSGGFRLDELEQVVRMTAGGRINLESSISHRFSLAEAGQAVELLRSGGDGVRRVVVCP